MTLNLTDLLSHIPQLDKLILPPPVFETMGGEILAFDQTAKTLQVRFPTQARWANPLGAMQGGAITMAIDNTVGPLSFLVAPPSVTKSLEVRFLKPVSAEITHIIIDASVSEQSDRHLILQASVHNSNGLIFAQATATHIILRRK